MLCGRDQTVTKLRDAGYENNVAAVVAKMLLRGGESPPPVSGVDADV